MTSWFELVSAADSRLRIKVSSGVAALPSAKAPKHNKVPSSLRPNLPVLPAEDWRKAFVPVALMGTMFTGTTWPAMDGATSAMLKVVLFATVSIWNTARLPAVKGTGGAPMLNLAEFVTDNGA